MQLTIMGRRWNLVFVDHIDGQGARGECDPPDAPKKEIRIRARLNGEEKLEVLIHEMLHAASWHIDEEFVKQFSADAARNLTQLGFTDGEENRNGHRASLLGRTERPRDTLADGCTSTAKKTSITIHDYRSGPLCRADCAW